MADKLTIKQEKYAQGLFAGLSQREAYKQAYPCKNMSDKTIDENACRLAGDSKVVARIESLTNELKERNMVTVEKVLAEYAKIGFADIKDFLRFGMKDVTVGIDEEGNEIKIPKQVIEVKESEEVDGTLISEVAISAKGVFSFKLHDKKGALDSMAKHLGMFVEKVESKNLNINDDVSNLTPDERQKRIAELQKTLGYSK
jgi:phage terminase small subunit